MISVSPILSVIMPVWNGEAFLREAIESILNQTFSDFEFLVIYDQSTDRSLEILESIKDPRIKLIHNQKKDGISAALNLGIAESKGKYIARMDCDDVSLPERFEKQVQFLEDYPSVGLVTTNGKNIDENGKILGAAWWGSEPLPLEWVMLWQTAIAHPTVMMRKAVLDQHHLRYQKMAAEDSDLWVRFCLKASVIRLDSVLFHYRLRRGSLFNTQKQESLIQAIKSCEYLAENISKKPCSPVHRYLTVYANEMGEKISKKQVPQLIDWIDDLMLKSSDRWQWSEERHAAARNYTVKHLLETLHGFGVLQCWRWMGQSKQLKKNRQIGLFLHHLKAQIKKTIKSYLPRFQHE